MLSRKDYEMIAHVLRNTGYPDIDGREVSAIEDDRARLADAFASQLYMDNPRFDRERFIRACGVEVQS